MTELGLKKNAIDADLNALAAALGCELAPALVQLKQLYLAVDSQVQRSTQGLDLPCHKGCDGCCHESVFITPLEFCAVWDYVQREKTPTQISSIINKGISIYSEYKEMIVALGEPPEEGERDHFRIAEKIKFTCPLLSDDGACSVYPVRELYARLFGASFNDTGGIYGCHLVGDHLMGKEVALLTSKDVAERLNALPMTFMRQVYPYYIHLLYGELEHKLEFPPA